MRARLRQRSIIYGSNMHITVFEKVYLQNIYLVYKSLPRVWMFDQYSATGICPATKFWNKISPKISMLMDIFSCKVNINTFS